MTVSNIQFSRWDSLQLSIDYMFFHLVNCCHVLRLKDADRIIRISLLLPTAGKVNHVKNLFGQYVHLHAIVKYTHPLAGLLDSKWLHVVQQIVFSQNMIIIIWFSWSNINISTFFKTYFFNNSNLAEITSCSTFYQWLISS